MMVHVSIIRLASNSSVPCQDGTIQPTMAVRLIPLRCEQVKDLPRRISREVAGVREPLVHCALAVRVRTPFESFARVLTGENASGEPARFVMVELAVVTS